jgi:hypothetical protein
MSMRMQSQLALLKLQLEQYVHDMPPGLPLLLLALFLAEEGGEGVHWGVNRDPLLLLLTLFSHKEGGGGSVCTGDARTMT